MINQNLIDDLIDDGLLDLKKNVEVLTLVVFK